MVRSVKWNAYYITRRRVFQHYASKHFCATSKPAPSLIKTSVNARVKLFESQDTRDDASEDLYGETRNDNEKERYANYRPEVL